MSLDLIKKENISRKVKKEFNYAFRLEQSWIDSYRVAEGILNGNISIPSETTHFHSYTETEKIEWFEQKVVPNGKFLKKIDNIYFYWSPN